MNNKEKIKSHVYTLQLNFESSIDLKVMLDKHILNVRIELFLKHTWYCKKK